MEPRDVMDDAAWEALLTEVADEALMRVMLTDREGSVLMAVGKLYPICKEIRDRPESLTTICSQTASAMLAQVRHTLEPVVDECEAGMLRIAVPIVRDKELVGQVTACGRVPHGGAIETFLVSRAAEIPEAEVVHMARISPFVTEQYAREVADRIFQKVSSS